MKRRLRHLLSDFAGYCRAWYGFVFVRGYKQFLKFEKIKDFIATGLYRQRGRFSRPFAHMVMMGTIALAVSLAPLIADSIPGQDPTLAQAFQNTEIDLFDPSDQQLTTQRSERLRDQVVEHIVKGGETLSTIANRYGVSTDTLRWENNLGKNPVLKPGQKVRVLPLTGVRIKVARGETIYSIAKKYSASAQAIVDYPFNTFSDNETFALAVGQELIVPDGERPDEPTSNPNRNIAQRTPNAGTVSGSGRFVWPMGGVITQRFSWFHRAIDVAAPFGTPIVAADAGRVIVAGWPDNSGYGNRVVLDHGNGYTTLYAHMSRVDVVVGQTVNRGDRLGLEGSTGRSTGPHLHFEIRLNGAYQNPLTYLK